MRRPLPFHSNLVWPSAGIVGLFISVYCIVWACFWLIGLSVPEPARSTFDTEQVIGCRSVILGFAAGFYAAFRLVRFHPACSPLYAGWLKLSPWTASRPLPAGPVHPVWQDAAVVGALTAIAIWHHVSALLPVTIFIFIYLAGFTFVLAYTRRWGPCLILGFLWPALMFPGVAPIPPSAPVLPAAGIAAAIICVIWYGHRQSLRAFPWEFIKVSSRPLAQAEIRIRGVGTPSGSGTQYHLGWPYLMLSPKVRPPAISQRTNLALGTLAGWWSFCVIKASDMDPSSGGVVLVFAIVAALIRLAVYTIGVAAPFNIWGRLATGRIVVPGFDKVFVTPLAVVVAAIIGNILINHSGTWYAVTESAVIAVLWWVLFGGGPTLRSWALTGQFRFRSPAIAHANKQMVRPV
jgi:hypothetical protein